MKIGIVSDSHGDTHALEDMLAHSAAAEAELWLHAGDVLPDADYLAMLTQQKVYKVPGNNDWPDSRVPEELVLELGGHRLLLTHGHMFGVRWTTDMLVQHALNQDCDVAIYGHTHCAEFLPGAMTVVNPGSISRPRDERAGSFMLLELLPEQQPTGELYRLER